MKKRVFLLGLLFLVGLSVLLYPLISSEWNRHRSDAMIDSYTQTVSQAPAEDRSAWIDSARQYNAALGGKHFPDAFANITREESAGTSPEALAKGAGTHCVISAHRGLPSATLFTDLDQLAAGDRFYLHVLGETLAYAVDSVTVVEPTEVSSLLPDAGGDYVTLLTCTPYVVNTQRLLVRGHRVAYEPETEQQEAQQTVRSLHTSYVLWVAVGLGVTLVFILLLWRGQRSKGKRLS